MKLIQTYKWIGLLLINLSISSCGNSKSDIAKTVDNHKDDAVQFQEVMISGQQFSALKMQIDTLKQRKMSGYVEANGQLEVPPQNEATITTITGAKVVSIEVIEGDKVDKNQTVAYVSHPSIVQLQSDYLNAYSNSQYLDKEYQRQLKLYEAGVASGMNYQKATADYQASKAMVNGLEAQLKQYSINVSGVRKGTIYQRVALLSPIEGYVQKVKVKTGQFVQPQTDIIDIVNTHHVHADLMVFERDVDKIKKGQMVRFVLQSRPNEDLTAEIYSVSKTFEQDPKAVHVHAEIENKDSNLIPGMFIQGRIEVDNIQTNAMPESAISIDGNKSFIFKAVPEGDDWSFRPVEVITGEKDGDWVSIRLMSEQKQNERFAYNNAYYLMAEFKKGDAEHSH
ncbi:efflux RND transporter periplasmic adaptor subunit [Maribacter sp. ACAM166]|uniref:efflux RND transporter periplasmic adaptor subunit n=1 Tax=Maribacter sp. ACAM166 TaxID=2508996 RepID=UPI0010FD5CC6|nr:efflux RND transporter periplasmic adaptor subunit [Maribacter sp. ACAM166]TLP79779.1 efflux RND transporter periplasmic adaptor subunit [Maribacter sp. ACAM166]